MGVKVLRSNEGDSVNRTGDAIFIGEVRARNLAEGSKDVTASVVQFAAGAHTKMHRHTSDQMLLVLSGIGKVGDTEHEHVIGTGDSVLITAGTDHWHGAGDTGSPMTHLSVMRGDSQSTVL
jgi:quercetin dioxygenase-like cupin family protein